MRKLIFALVFAVSFSSVSFAADCGIALFEPSYGIFAHEGGWQNSRNDGGNWSSGKVGVGHLCGGTKYGLACAYHPNLDIRNLTKDAAAHEYQQNECRAIRIKDLLGQRDPTLLLDLAVNMGSGTANRMFHKARNACKGEKSDPDVSISTELSDDDVAWYNAFTAEFNHRKQFLFALALAGIDRYTDIVESNPKKAQWLLGWIVRVNPLND